MKTSWNPYEVTKKSKISRYDGATMREVRYATGELAEIGDIWCTIPYTSPHYTIYKTVSCTDSNLTFDQ